MTNSRIKTAILNNNSKQFQEYLKNEKDFTMLFSFVKNNMEFLSKSVEYEKNIIDLMLWLEINKEKNGYDSFVYKIMHSSAANKNFELYWKIASVFFKDAAPQTLRDILQDGDFNLLWKHVKDEDKKIKPNKLCGILDLSRGKLKENIEVLGEEIVTDFFKKIGWGIFNTLRMWDINDEETEFMIKLAEKNGYKLRAKVAYMFIDYNKKPITFNLVMNTLSCDELEKIVLPTVNKKVKEARGITKENWEERKKTLEKHLLFKKLNQNIEEKEQNKKNKI